MINSQVFTEFTKVVQTSSVAFVQHFSKQLSHYEKLKIAKQTRGCK